MNAKAKKSSESGKRKQRIVSPYSADNSALWLSGRSLISPNTKSHSRSKRGTQKAAGPDDGGRDTDITNPVASVTLSTFPSSLTRRPIGEMNKACTGICSENNFCSKSKPSAREMMFSFIAEEWGISHACLFALITGSNSTPRKGSTLPTSKRDPLTRPPLQGSHANCDARGRNCSKQNVARQPF